MASMANFMIRFLFCNFFICVIIGILLAARRLLKSILTNRMQYNLWFLLFGLLAIPFVPIPSGKLSHFLSWVAKWKGADVSPAKSAMEQAVTLYQPTAANWMNDLSISITQRTPLTVGFILCILWIAGIVAIVIFMIKSGIRLDALKRSALPLQNQQVRKIYRRCLDEMNIAREIPVYSTAFLKTPFIVGLFRPCIYLPIHLISDYHAADIRYMLLHELQHYKHKDALANYLMNTAGILYWFNPLIWYALQEMRCDREVACDTSVLKMLEENSYEAYGSTLINFAEKVSLTPFPFVSGIGGSMAHIQKRILNIANYRPVTFKRKLRSIFSYILIAVFLSGFVPVLSIQAADQDHYYFNEKNKNISHIDLSSDFRGYEGSFVLYDTAADSWQIYDMDNATARVTPVSTYKIYIALSGLESGIITPEQSRIAWDGQENIFDIWNADQTLESAMQNSVNWYFQTIDEQTGLSAIKDYVRKIGYGNQAADGDTSSYWLNSSLKISPVEQVEMLKKLYYNEFHFSPEAVEAVRQSICLFTTAEGSFYGKTGTESVNGQYISGWFIGFIEKNGHPCFFATNIRDRNNASGAAAAEITFSILSNLNYLKSGTAVDFPV